MSTMSNYFMDYHLSCKQIAITITLTGNCFTFDKLVKVSSAHTINTGHKLQGWRELDVGSKYSI